VWIYEDRCHSFYSCCEDDSYIHQNPFARTLRRTYEAVIDLLRSHPIYHCYRRPVHQLYAYCVVAAMSTSPLVHEPLGRTDLASAFRKCWVASTADNNLTLHGFRRFKTTQLLNLRFLGNEIADMDHIVYQAGFGLGLSPSPDDRLGLAHRSRHDCRARALVSRSNTCISH
jgi:hypothetical protein